jgi:thiol-activated cytolysin
MGRQLVSSLLTVLVAGANTAAAAAPIDDYVRGLRYDPRELLAVSEPGSTESLPGRSEGREGVIICTSKPQGLTETLDEVTILSPLNGVVFPGALIRANRALADGKPDPISLPRGAATISIDLPGIGAEGVRMLDNPRYSSVQTAITEMLAIWINSKKPEGYVNAARSSYNMQKAYSQTQLALQLGFGTKWSSNSITANLKASTSSESSTTVKLFRQVFYTVSLDPPSQPSAVFAAGLSLDDLRTVVDDRNPPAYIRSVDYGRIILVRMDTSSNETEADLKAALNYVTQSGTEINGETENKLKRIVGESRFTVLTLGGNAEVASQTIDPSNLEKIKDVIQVNSIFDRNNPGYPIAYTAAFLKDNTLATLTFSTSYTKSDCVSHANGFVTLQHSGGYVARFNVSWSQKAADGQSDVSQSWASGNRTAGWRKTIDLPGDASKVRIEAEAATGLVWQPWNEALNRTINGPDNKCYRVTGTTLHPSWDNDC